MTATIDLHIHSSFSTDGEISPEELVAMAARAGIRQMALTDHNRVDGVEPARVAGEKHGIRVVPAVEIECNFQGMYLHILGYGIRHTAPEFAGMWESVKAMEQASSSEYLDKVEALGVVIDREKVMSLCKEGIVIAEIAADVALADPRNDGKAILAPYRPGGERSDNPGVNFYWDYCSSGKPAHVSVPYMSIIDCIALITGAGGLPVLAHPGQSLRSRPDCIPELAALGIRGVETFCSYHDAVAAEHWQKEAAKNNLFITCGSDFHGKTKPSVMLGRHGGGAKTEELLQPFFQALKETTL